MPEGDVVYQAARRLQAALAGRVLTHSDFRVPRLATTDLRGRPVREVVSRGKHLLARVDGDLTVHSHLMMDGAWDVRPTRSGRRAGPWHEVRLVLGNEHSTASGLRLPLVEVLRTSREHQAVGHLGPDLLGSDWDAEEAARRLARQPGRPVVDALLDQRNLAGIGNVYKAELCFLRGVSPVRPVSQAGPLLPLAELAQRLLEANRNRVGHVTTGDLRPGRGHWVYGRAGRPCRRCGTGVLRADLGIPPRVTFWCPRCQP